MLIPYKIKLNVGKMYLFVTIHSNTSKLDKQNLQENNQSNDTHKPVTFMDVFENIKFIFDLTSINKVEDL